MAESVPRTVTLPLRAWVLVGIVVVIGLSLFTAQLVFIVQQRSLIAHQDQVATHQARRARPVLHTARALLGSPEATRAALARGGRALASLQRILDAADSQHLVGVTTTSLRRVPGLVADVREAVAILDRTYPTLRSSLHVQRGSLSIQERSLAVQEQTLALLRESIGIQRDTRGLAAQTLAVAQGTLAHAASLDRKTGGPLLGSGG